VLESALVGEIADHLGHEKHERAESGKTRSGTRSTTVITDLGPAEIAVPRDRVGSFEPQIVKKRQRPRWRGRDGAVAVSRGLTHGEITAHLGQAVVGMAVAPVIWWTGAHGSRSIVAVRASGAGGWPTGGTGRAGGRLRFPGVSFQHSHTQAMQVQPHPAQSLKAERAPKKQGVKGGPKTVGHDRPLTK
jgi:hypothetical protein